MLRRQILFTILAMACGARVAAAGGGPPIIINDGSPLKISSPRGWVEGSDDRELADSDQTLTVTRVRVIQSSGAPQEVAVSGEPVRVELHHGKSLVFVRANMNKGKGIAVNTGGSLKGDFDRTSDRKRYTNRRSADHITDVKVMKGGAVALNIGKAASPVTIEIYYE